MAERQKIDDRVLLAARRAIARARGQEQVSIEPVDQGVSPSTSARLYKISTTGEIDTAAVAAAAFPRDGRRRSGDDAHEEPAPSAAEAVSPVEGTQATSTPIHEEPTLEPAPQQTASQSAVAGEGAQTFAEDGQARQATMPHKMDATGEAGAQHRSTSATAQSRTESFRGTTARQSSVRSAIKPEEDEVLAKALEPKTHPSFSDDSAPVPRVGADIKFSEGLPTRKASAPEEAGVFLDTFFAQLKHCGVKNVVVTPGMRSTPLAMKAYEHYGDVYMNVDERSAAFFALGLAKATGNVVALVCPGGTAVGNVLPAVLEAEASRVPLLLLSADHPARLQGVGAPHTCDQLHLFGHHVRKFVQMPLPSLETETLAFARQAAMDACIAAHGALPNVASADAGPVHLNFPFEEPLVPVKCETPVETSSLPAAVVAGQGLLPADAKGLFGLIKGKRVIALCGEGTCESVADARQLLNFAHMRNVPLLADPLSGLRCYSDSMIIDHYDAIFGGDRAPHAEVVIRFGRWPVSERAMRAVQKMGAMQIVVDMREPRDATNSTTIFARCAPTVFADALANLDTRDTASTRACKEWCELNNEAAEVVRGVRLRRDNGEMEGAYVYETMEAAPDGSLVFCANSMSIRALDTFYCKADKQLRVLCNRGLGGVDGTISSALGAAQAYEQTTLITGDLAFLRDVNALALQNEMRLREMHTRKPTPSVIVILLNNGGAGIFDMMPQKSVEPYFERLFLAPQAVDYKRIADGFGVTCRTVSSVNTFRRTYASLIGEAGINVIEVLVPLAGIESRYADYWRL